MKERASAPIILLIALILIFLALASGGFYLFQKERVHNLELQDSMEEIKTKQRITESRLRDSEKTVADLQMKLKEARDQIDSLTEELRQEKQARGETQGRLEQLGLELEQHRELRADLERRLQDAQEETRNVTAQLQELDNRKVELEEKVRELEEMTQNIELGKIVVAPESSAAAESKQSRKKEARKKQEPQVMPQEEATGMNGKVLVINKEYNFVVINLGSRDGVDVGMEFAVYQGNKHIGDIKVEKVHDAMSAAGFVTDGLKDKIGEGDKVALKAR